MKNNYNHYIIMYFEDDLKNKYTSKNARTAQEAVNDLRKEVPNAKIVTCAIKTQDWI